MIFFWKKGLPDSGGVMSDGTRLVTEDDLEQQLEVLHLDG